MTEVVLGGKTYTLGAGQTAYAAEGKAESLVIEGWIKDPRSSKNDLHPGSFLLGGKNDSQTIFRTGVKAGEREPAILLDGKKSTFQTAIKPGRKASVTYVKVGNDLWVSKVEVTSAAK